MQSRTKELYLSRAVEVQPCFNRDIISDLSDQATSNLLELGAWAEGEGVQINPGKVAEIVTNEQAFERDEGGTDTQILQAATTGNSSLLSDWISRLQETPGAGDRFTRVFLAAISDSPQVTIEVLLQSGLVNIQAEDGINERNCIHEAAINGKEYLLDTAIASGVDVSRSDSFGRIPLHYACMHGQVNMVQKLLDRAPNTVDNKDHDNFSPLIHAIVHGEEACVKQLLIYGARIDPASEADHVPLNLACQHGSMAIARLLLEKDVRLMPDAEGLFPQHLVARSGAKPELLPLLEDYGADLDQRDKLYQWTPLFHAAAEGHIECMRLLLDRKVDPKLVDEKGLSSLYHATWEGHLECMMLLIAHYGKNSGPTSDLMRQFPSSSALSITKGATMDTDGIPNLSLPPPIIPIRRYGHNFLDTKTLIQITFEAPEMDPILLYRNSKLPAARLTISSKVSDIIPRNIMLPIQEDSRNVAFQVDNPHSFAVDFDIYPTFGSKIIARGVALPHLFNAERISLAHYCVPLFDPRLRTVGQVSFTSQVIKPFQGVPLEISEFATYWKATSQLDSQPSAFITGSSLSGDYVHVKVQLTNDGIPVVYPSWSIDYHGIEIPVCRLSYQQYVSLCDQGQGSHRLAEHLFKGTSDDVLTLQETLAQGYGSLKEVLETLPEKVHINIQVLYPTTAQEKEKHLGPSANINDFADAVLGVVFKQSRKVKEQNPEFMQSIVFTSYNADLCTALNWKQPNCEHQTPNRVPPSPADKTRRSSAPSERPRARCGAQFDQEPAGAPSCSGFDVCQGSCAHCSRE